jgi:two-component system, OmpR family, phosphate regulon sensor histidine kinase PhoR
MNRDVALRGAVAGALVALGALVLGALAVQDGASSSRWTIIIIAALVCGGVVGYLALYRSARAIHAVSSSAARISEGELGERVSLSAGPVNELTYEFNSMAVRVQQLFDSVAAEHARLEAVFDASTDAMVALSPTTIVQFLNPAAVQVFGSNMTTAVGHPFIEMARDYELDALVRRAVGMSAAGEARVITFGASRVPLRAVAVPIREGGDWAVLLILTDLREVQRVDQVRRDFLSNVSHELRTPLASIRALVETLEDGIDDKADREEFLKRIRQQVERLTLLVNELLDLSRIESGAIELHPEPVDLGALVAEAASLLQTRTDAEDIKIVCPEDHDAVVQADRTSVLRIVSNLLDNAIKYSPRGSTIHATTADEGDLVALSVRDEGSGIAPQELQRVFERFYKGEASRSSAGVGLGLAIVKHLVRAHGGTATVTSVPGEGSTFTVRLPKHFVGTLRG